MYSPVIVKASVSFDLWNADWLTGLGYNGPNTVNLSKMESLIMWNLLENLPKSSEMRARGYW